MPYLSEMSQAERSKIKKSDYIFPEQEKWPIQTKKQAMIALTFTRWPQHKDVAKTVRAAVFKKYPDLKKKFKGGKYAKEETEMQTDTNTELMERLNGLHSLVTEADNLGREKGPDDEDPKEGLDDTDPGDLEDDGDEEPEDDSDSED